MHPPPRIAPSAPPLHNTKRLQLNAPQYTGRFYYLLTLKRNTFWLTKVNNLDCITQIINELWNTNCNQQLQQKTAELTKSACNKINQTMYISSNSMPGSAVAPQPISVPARSVEALGTGLFFFGSFLLEKQQAQRLIEATEKHMNEIKEMNEKLNRLQKAICVNRTLIEILKTEPTDTRQKPLNLL